MKRLTNWRIHWKIWLDAQIIYIGLKLSGMTVEWKGNYKQEEK